VALASFAATAAAKPVTQLWVFGDSTVDTGWYRIPKSGSHPPTHSGEANFDAFWPQRRCSGEPAR
jgi:hypothetical protein